MKNNYITTLRKKYLFFIGLLFLVFTQEINAQQDSQYTQYMYNTMAINPAYAGNRGRLGALALYRYQWAGLEGAPRTFNFSVNSPIPIKKVGLGLTFVSDKIGPISENNLYVDFSYTIKLPKRYKLSFGLKGGLTNLNLDTNKLLYQNIDNDLSIKNLFSPVIGVGVFLHNSRKWYVGLSSPNLLATKHYEDYKTSQANEEIHMFLTGGYVFNLSKSLKLKPAVLLKAITGAPLAIDVSGNFLIKDKFTLGLGYRYNAALSFLAGMRITDELMAGYTYDYSTSELSGFESGSHEVFLRYELATKYRNKINPRFF